MEPITFVFLVLGIMLYRNVIFPLLARALTKQVAPNPAVPALETKENTKAYDCEVYSERLLDEKMVEAELMKIEEMAVCDNPKCPNCEPSRPKIVLNHYKEQRNAAEDIIRNNAQKKRLLDEAKKKMQNREANYVYPKPPEVPWNAQKFQHYDPSYMRDVIVWKWVDEKGNIRAVRQLVSPQFEVESYSVYSDQSNKPITIWGGDTNSTGPR